MSGTKTLDRHFFADAKADKKLTPNTTQITAEQKILGLPKKEIKKLTLESVQTLLGLDVTGIMGSHVVLIEIAKANKELLACLGYKPSTYKNKVVGVSKINI